MRIYVDESQITRIMDELQCTFKEAKPILKTAINNTAKKAQSDLIDRAKEKYAYSKKLGKKDLKLFKATTSNLTARLYSSGAGTELSHFKRRGPVAWAETVPGAPPTEAHGLKGEPFGKIQKTKYKGFIITFKSGHTSIARRVDPEERFRKGVPIKTELGDRYLQTVLTVSVSGMIGNEERVWNFVGPRLGEYLNNEVEAAIARRKK